MNKLQLEQCIRDYGKEIKQPGFSKYMSIFGTKIF